MGVDRMIFQRPEEATLSVERVKVDETCPACGSNDVRRYPVANYIGPRIVTKCQDCFHHIAVDLPTDEDMWPPWQTPTRGWTASRAG
jgi:hypothetical protein